PSSICWYTWPGGPGRYFRGSGCSPRSGAGPTQRGRARWTATSRRCAASWGPASSVPCTASATPWRCPDEGRTTTVGLRPVHQAQAGHADPGQRSRRTGRLLERHGLGTPGHVAHRDRGRPAHLAGARARDDPAATGDDGRREGDGPGRLLPPGTRYLARRGRPVGDRVQPDGGGSGRGRPAAAGTGRERVARAAYPDLG